MGPARHRGGAEGPAERGHREYPDHELAAAEKDLNTAAHHHPPPQIRYAPRKLVPTADLIPDLDGYRCARLVWDVEQVVQQTPELGRHPRHRSTRPIREGDESDTVVGSHEDLRVEAWQYPSCPTTRCPPASLRKNARPMPAHPRIQLVLGLEHGCKRCRFEHRAVPVGTTAEKSRDEPRQVAARGVDSVGPNHPFAVGDGFRPAAPRM